MKYYKRNIVVSIILACLQVIIFATMTLVPNKSIAFLNIGVIAEVIVAWAAYWYFQHMAHLIEQENLDYLELSRYSCITQSRFIHLVLLAVYSMYASNSNRPILWILVGISSLVTLFVWILPYLKIGSSFYNVILWENLAILLISIVGINVITEIFSSGQPITANDKYFGLFAVFFTALLIFVWYIANGTQYLNDSFQNNRQ